MRNLDGLISYKDDLIQRLKDPEYAIEYLKCCIEDEDPSVFLLALKYVAEAQIGGLAKLSLKTKLNREHLYRILSNKGNPEFHTLMTLLRALGLQFDIKSRLRKKHTSIKKRARVHRNRRISPLVKK